ncbi:DUF3551 domain-containing protein [Bradyrhizobium prioriisuperbiae]|uniref:DUF3551 domain-containing protein n=1 Tax=Bradyrhizobium prioriisuperbiae TaxID=2854389 RepID=UPI0028E8E2EE|nr:DUF3551 domain-containing protein [Bradyrhizobium prioritasuperba]
MRRILLAGVAVVGFGMGLATSVTPAQAQTGPICMIWREITDCRYFSMAQCNASASGIGADCLYNPGYAGRVESAYDDEPAPRQRPRRRHHRDY